MNKQKNLWEKLARENWKYFINSDFGRSITDDQFRHSGKEDYEKLIIQDPLLKNRDTILDFGCGAGRLTEYMANDFKKVVGVDISPTMISLAKKRLNKLKNVEFLEINGSELPLPDNSIDQVFAFLVFQHIKNRQMVEKLFTEVIRILKPRGIFKVLLRSDKQRDMNRWWSGVEYDEGQSKKLYEMAGFKLLKIEHRDRSAYWLWLTKDKKAPIKSENWIKGKNKTLRFYRAKLPWKAQQFNRIFPLHSYFGPMIKGKKEVKVADIGAGMFCTIGSQWENIKVTVFPSDALADDFNQILKERGVVPLIPVKKQDMESLTYDDNFFDIVHCVNALDHTPNPLKAISEMYRVCKPGGFIYLRHFVNVGEHERYFGLHMWNINTDNKDNFLIWNKSRTFNINEYFPGFKSTKKTELDYEDDDMVVSILNKK